MKQKRRNFFDRRIFCKYSSKKKIKEYIRNRLQDDIVQDQISIKEYIEPFGEEDPEKEKLVKETTYNKMQQWSD